MKIEVNLKNESGRIEDEVYQKICKVIFDTFHDKRRNRLLRKFREKEFFNEAYGYWTKVVTVINDHPEF